MTTPLERAAGSARIRACASTIRAGLSRCRRTSRHTVLAGQFVVMKQAEGDVNAIELVKHALGESLPLSRVGKVDRYGQRPDATGPQGVTGVPQPVSGARGEGEVSTPARQSVSDDGADAPSAAREQHRPARKTVHPAHPI